MEKFKKVFRATLSVTSVIILSKLCGFIRMMIMAYYYGTGMESDAYTSAYSMFYLPVLLFNSCITSTIIPMYIDQKTNSGEKNANRFASNAICVFGTAAIIIAVLMIIFARQICGLVYQGFDPGKLTLNVELTRIMLVSLVFNVTSIILSSLLNAREKFVQAQLTGFPLSFAIIIACVFFSGRYGIHALAWGVFASGVLQVLIQIPFFRRWFRFTPRLDLKDSALRRLLVLSLPAMLSMAVSELNHMIDHALASSLEHGSMTALTYSYNLITFIIGVLVVPVTTIIFSRMSKLVAQKDTEGIITTVKTCTEALIMILLPIIVICAIASKDIIRVAYGSGRFDDSSIVMTAGPFMFYVIGVLSFGLRDLMNRTFHAMQNTLIPFVVACIAVCINIVLNFILRRLMGASGLALATSIAGSTAMLMMFFMLKRRLGKLNLLSTLITFLKAGAAAAACGLVCVLLMRILPMAHGRIVDLFRLGLVALCGIAAYIIGLIALRERRVFDAARSIINKVRH